jgi:hypothetical protein
MRWWLCLLGFTAPPAEKDGYIGYEKPYATSHEELDSDHAFQQDVRTAATTLVRALKMQFDGSFSNPGQKLKPASPK